MTPTFVIRCTRAAIVLFVLSLSRVSIVEAQPSPGTDSGGFQTGRAYFSPEPFEAFDVLSGTLMLSFTDLELSGNAGHMLRFVRTGAERPNGQILGLEGYPLVVVGGRWGYVGEPFSFETPAKYLSYGPLLQYADGKTQQTFFMDQPNTANTTTIQESMQWLQTVDLIRYNMATRTLYFPDGRVCQYDYSYGDTFRRYLSWCKDSFDNLMFEINRSGYTVTVTQFVGGQSRDVVLTYPSTYHTGMPTSMTYAGRTWAYTRTGTTLTVTSPESQTWTFTDTSITTPLGGQIDYTFTPQLQTYEGIPDPDDPIHNLSVFHGNALTQRVSSGPSGTVGGTWQLQYAFGFYPTSTDGPLHLPSQVTVTTPSAGSVLKLVEK